MSHLLQPGQKTFVQRLDSQPDDRKAWLNSIAQSVAGRSLDVLRDADEHVLYDRFTPIIRDLDNLTHLAKADVDTAKKEVFSLEISSFVDGISKDLVRIPLPVKQDQLEVSKQSLLRYKVADLRTNRKNYARNDQSQTRTRYFGWQRQRGFGHLHEAAVS